MHLYLLESKRPFHVDEKDAFLVRAKDPKEAREITNPHHSDEGDIWLDPTQSSCRRVKEEGRSKVIIFSFNAG